MSKAFFWYKKKEENKIRNYLFLLLPRVFSPCLCASPFFTPELPHFWARTDLQQPSVLLSLLLHADQGQSGVHCCSCFVRSSLLFFQSTSGLREEARRPGKEADVFLFVPDQLKSPEKPPLSPKIAIVAGLPCSPLPDSGELRPQPRYRIEALSL